MAPEGPIDLPVAYAGEPGAFAEDAVIAAFGDIERTALGSFREVFEAVANGRTPAGVVPIENVINGTVRENYDLLLEFDLQIRGEVVVPVRLCLAAPGRGSCSRPTTRRAPARPSSNAASGPPRRSCRPGRLPCSGWRSSPTTSATWTATGPGSSSSRCRAAHPCRWQYRVTVGGRRSSSRYGTSPGRCWPCSACSPITG